MFEKVKILGIAAALATVPVLVSAASIKVFDVTGGGSVLLGEIGDTGVLTPASLTGTTASGMYVSITVSPQDVPGLSRLSTIGLQTSGVGDIKVVVTEDGFGGGAGIGASNLELGVTASAVGDNLKAWGYVDNSNALFGQADQIGATAISFDSSVAGTQKDNRYDTAVLNNPFSMTTKFIIRHDDLNDQTNFTATQIAAIPVPAAGLLLLTALGGLGVASRRRKTA